MTQREQTIHERAVPPSFALPAPGRNTDGQAQRMDATVRLQPLDQSDLLEQRLMGKAVTVDVDVAADPQPLVAVRHTSEAGAKVHETLDEHLLPRARTFLLW